MNKFCQRVMVIVLTMIIALTSYAQHWQQMQYNFKFDNVSFAGEIDALKFCFIDSGKTKDQHIKIRRSDAVIQFRYTTMPGEQAVLIIEKENEMMIISLDKLPGDDTENIGQIKDNDYSITYKNTIKGSFAGGIYWIDNLKLRGSQDAKAVQDILNRLITKRQVLSKEMY